MLEIRFHGRGGQGSVTAAELMAQAAISEGKYAQAFPSFGPERRGAPVTAFLRVSERPIALREKIESTDLVVILDPSLIDLVDVFHGLRQGASAVINCSAEDAAKMNAKPRHYRLITVDATSIALEAIGLPIANTAIIGALVKGMGLIEPGSLKRPLQKRFGRLAEKNIQALQRAYAQASISEPTLSSDSFLEASEGSYAEHLEKEALMKWSELETGGDIAAPGSSRQFLTGSWRMAGKPVFYNDKCNKCSLCWIFCPEDALEKDEAGYFACNEDYCKGCGICAQECPNIQPGNRSYPKEDGS